MGTFFPQLESGGTYPGEDNRKAQADALESQIDAGLQREAAQAREIERLQSERSAICRALVGRDDCADLVQVVEQVLAERREAMDKALALKQRLDKTLDDHADYVNDVKTIEEEEVERLRGVVRELREELKVGYEWPEFPPDVNSVVSRYDAETRRLCGEEDARQQNVDSEH